MTDVKSKSKFTGIECTIIPNISNFDYYCEDPAIGNYTIEHEVQSEIKDSDHAKLATILAQRKLRTGPDSIKIVKGSPQDDPSCQQVTLDELLSLYPLSVVEIIDEALINLSLLISHPSQEIVITDDKIWILYSYNNESRDYILRQLSELGFITLSGLETMDDTPHPKVTIESGGWARLQELQKKPTGGKDQAFVAMWFSKEMNEYYENAIKPAIEQDGTKCVRIDLQEHNNKICDEIIKEINKSKYVVADFTGNRGGVYYEAGFAHGLGIPVIWTIQKKDLIDVHFDTRQYNHIVYENVNELKNKLTNRIQATIIGIIGGKH